MELSAVSENNLHNLANLFCYSSRVWNNKDTVFAAVSFFRKEGGTMADTLIAYYSWSGRSAALATKLYQSIPGSELYHIETKRNYSRHFAVCAEQAFMEKRRNERPDIRVHLTGKQMLKYDRVILIYPIWCGISLTA